MPRSGLCRDCGKRVWVDDEGGCQFGHDPDCVSEIAEEPEPELPPPPFGEGEFPARLDVFNWGAFFLPAIWGIVYGVPLLVGLWIAALFLPIVLVGLVGSQDPGVVTGAVVISQVFSAAARLWAGTAANRLAWRQQMLRQTVLGLPPRFSERGYLDRQRMWTIGGAILTAVSLTGLVALLGLSRALGIEQPAETQLTWTEVGLTVGWTLAEVGLALWLSRKNRETLGSGPEAG